MATKATGLWWSTPSARVRGAEVWLPRLVLWGAILAAWEWYGRQVGSFYFTTVGATAEAVVRIFTDQQIYRTLAGSLVHMVAGFALAASVGIGAGTLMGISRRAEHVLDPYVNLLLVSAVSTLLPLLIVLFGPGLPFRVAVVFLFAVPNITVNVAAGVRSVDPGLVETARAFGASRWQVARHVLVPAATPLVVAGLRIGLARAISGMVAAELWVIHGTGALLKAFAEQRKLDYFFALMLAIMVVAVAANALLRLAEARVAPWAGRARS